MRLHTYSLKAISLALVLTFSFSQLLFAEDPRALLADAKASFDLIGQDRRPGAMDTVALSRAQSLTKSVVDSKNALQDIQNMQFSLTTANGDILKYVGDQLSQVTAHGSIINNIKTDATGNITDAYLKLPDGSLQVYQNGEVTGYQTPDGQQIIYQNGQIHKVFSKDNVETDYIYGPAESPIPD